jgi:ribosomal protein RSM22 (predicted rRNA methylase)
MQQVAHLMPSFSPSTQLDLGAGPGAAAWAAAEVWPSIRSVVLREADERMIAAGEQLAAQGFGGWTWQRADVRSALGTADLVTATYALGELEGTEARDVASRAWAIATGCFLIVEPGTPIGFAVIRDLRDHLIGEGAELIAPCPNADECPVTGDDWCHFAARLGRSSLHRQLKGADRSFEDEKFSYVAFAGAGGTGAIAGVTRAAGRLVRRPLRRRHFVELSICRAGEIQHVGVGHSHPLYKAVSKLAWGDAVPGPLLEQP